MLTSNTGSAASKAPARATAWQPAALWLALAAFALALPLSIAGLNAAAGAATALLLACALMGVKLDLSAAATPLTAALLVYGGVGALVSALGVDPGVSFGQLNKDFHKVWLLCVLLVSLRAAGTRRLERALGLGCAAAAVYGIGQALLLRTAGGNDLLRSHAFVHPVVYGELLGLCWLGALALWLKPSPDAPPRRALSAFLVVCGAALLLSQDRGALLGTAAGAALLALADRRYRRVAWLAALAVPGAVLLWELLPSNHNISAMIWRLRHNPHSADLARLTLWRVGLQIFRDHPWHGVGIGNYKTVFTHYFQGSFDGERVWGSAHDLYIHQAAERGLVGLAALGGVLWTMTKRAWDRARDRGSAADLWAFSACGAFLVMNLTEVAFQTEQVASLLIFIWAYAEARHGADLSK